MLSMTGFADETVTIDDISYTVTIKSVNSRFLEIATQLPIFMLSYEYELKNIISSKIARGKIDCSIYQKNGRSPLSLFSDQTSLINKMKEYNRFIKLLGLKKTNSLQDFFTYLDLVSKNTNLDSESVWERLKPSILKCLDELNKERTKEGNHTRKDLEAKLQILENAILEIEKKSYLIEPAIEANLRTKLTQVAGGIVEESRILSEIAAYAVKYTINEEIIRFKAHLSNFQSTLDEANCGKKLDFISQELNREANTIASKVFFPEISSMVIDIKQAVEDIREQIRNIE